MDKRLSAIAAHIPDGVGFIDVGTDHGYIPCEMAVKGYSGNIIASDVKPGPLSAAMKSAGRAGVSDRIRFTLSDGLEGCGAADVDTIIIAGMGGDNICGILDRAEWCMDGRYLLILQPMTKAEVLRYWLCCNGFEILSEELVEEGGVYQIITARFGDMTVLSEAELFTGEFRRDMLYRRFLAATSARFEKIVKAIPAGSNAPAHELDRLIYRQLKTMEVRYDTGE